MDPPPSLSAKSDKQILMIGDVKTSFITFVHCRIRQKFKQKVLLPRMGFEIASLVSRSLHPRWLDIA